MPSRRVVLALILAVAVAPDTWLHSSAPDGPPDWRIAVTPQPFEPGRSGPFIVSGQWVLTGYDRRFGGLSALVTLSDDAFLAASDTGRMARFTVADDKVTEGFLDRPGGAEARTKFGADIEALTRDPESGTLWAAYEWGSRVVRFTPSLSPKASIVPPQMAQWLDNSGPESFVRLSDGRFLAIQETARVEDDTRHRAVLFDTDPIEIPTGRSFLIARTGDYRIVDAAMLDEDRVLLLLRRFEFNPWPTFDTAIASFRISDIESDAIIAPRMLAEFGDAIFRENYEGLAITRTDRGTALWLISDDNFAAFQSTTLLRLEYSDATTR